MSNEAGLSSPEADKAFEEEGINLWKQLQKELAANYEVVDLLQNYFML